MEIKIKSKNLSLQDSQKINIEQKVEKLAHLADRLADPSSEFRVEISHYNTRNPKDAYSCQLTIFAPHAVIRTETRGETLENSVDDCLQKIRKPISRYKVKIKRLDIKKSNQTEDSTADLQPSDTEEEFEIPKILRRKRFSDSSPLTEDEAIEKMELIGHNFLLFNNQDTGRFSVVYKRSDGFYGIIEPKKDSD